MSFRTRFAPSPTGPLHLGHAFSAMTAHDMARQKRGTFLLRMDDIDRERSKPAWEALAFEDLRWLGLTWPEPVLRQSSSAPHFERALATLAAKDLLYPCSCTRADIENAASAPQEGVPTHGPDGRIYPGTCRGRAMSSRLPGDALRLDMARAIESVARLPKFTETGAEKQGRHRLKADDLLTTIGDPVISRRGGGIAYHLAVIVDDAAQQITHVVRGMDLFEATRIHVLLQTLLDLPTPIYHHHRLIRDGDGKRLAKRDDARALRKFREEGYTPADVRRMVGLELSTGIPPV
ncbi:MAG: tRNA glutamyl-Q(34) synthetase GluQRS [Pseudomonadota bacterium]